MNYSRNVFLRKAKKVIGHTLCFRNAEVSDASFILSLRSDESLNRHLSATSPSLIEQEMWLDKYSSSSDQAYFIIEYRNCPIGTVRLYDPEGTSFCWGSWILVNANRPAHAAIESALMVYSYATEHLGFASAHFDVRKQNVRVWNFHERFGAKRIGETDDDYIYQIESLDIQISMARYAKYLPSGVMVQDNL